MCHRLPGALIALLLFADLAGARTWFIDASGTGDAPTIQAAADQCAPGDAIVLGPGTYAEQVDLPPLVTVSSSAGAAATTIDGGTEIGYCISIGIAQDNLIEGLRFVGARSGYGFVGGGVYANGSVTIRDCVFENSASGIHSAHAILGDGDLTLLDCEVRGGNGVLFGGSSLAIDGCLFEDNRADWFPAIVQIVGPAGPAAPTATVRRSVFTGNDGIVVGWDDNSVESLDLLVESNLFLANSGAALGPDLVPIWRSDPAQEGALAIVFRQNTIARHSGHSLIGPDALTASSLTLTANAITGNGRAPAFSPLLPAPLVIECNDVWGNDVGWEGIPDPTGTNGNIAEPPVYCGAEVGVFTVATNSPLRSINNSCGVQIGAFDVGCGPIHVTPVTWGRIKALYRSPGTR